jgi:hypothetical protein
MPTHTPSYARMLVPASHGAPIKSSSYLRLGAYTADESEIVTALKTTTSANSSESVTAISGAKNDGVFSSTGQKTSSVSNSVTSTHTTDNNGVLAYTPDDFQANVAGAALMKFGNGHTTEVTAGDAAYTVKTGIYKISGENGIKMTAGAGGTPANIEMTASDYIKQTANGPLSEITYGNSEKRTIGNAMEFFLGTKFTCMIGATTTLTMALTMSTMIGVALSFKLSFEFALNATASITIKFFATNSLTIGDKTDIVVGMDFKQVTGNSMKIVVGPDCKVSASDMKVLTGMDLKFAAAGDLKKVGINGTFCETDVKVTAADIKKGELTAAQQDLVSRMNGIEAVAGQITAVTKSAVLHL